LIDTKGAGLERITEKGIVANGQEFEVDCIVYATGFETAAGFTHRSGMDIYGREGQRLSEAWRDGTSTLHGWTAPGFPNCFWIQQTQATISVNGLYPMAYQAAHLAYVIRTASERKIRTLEATQEAASQWVRSIKESSKLKEAFYAECTPGYYNNEGQSGREGFANVTYAGGSQAFLEVLADWRSKGDLEGLDTRYF
jgi:cyclohexanone monooxygenase